MVEEPEHGWLVAVPSNSPENEFPTKYGNVTNCAGTTMDNQMISELFTHLIQAGDALGLDDDAFADTLASARAKMPPMQIGRYGQLQEWLHDWDRPDDHHRHVSHLYGLYPGNQISPFRTPELFKACRNSLEYRGAVSTPFYTVPEVPAPLVSPDAVLNVKTAPEVYEYDLQTKPGEEYCLIVI